MVLPITNLKKTRNRVGPKLLAVMVFIIFIATTLFVAVYNLREDRKSTQSKIQSEMLNIVKTPVDEEAGKEWFEKRKPLITEFPVPSKRNDIIGMLEKLKWKTAIEVGVQKGLFAKRMLDNWKSCTEYKLVDLWGREEGYQEPGNHSKE